MFQQNTFYQFTILGHYETTKLLLQEHLDNPYHAQILPVTHQNQTFEILV